LGTTRLRDRPRNRWQDEVRDDGRLVGGEGWQKKKKVNVYLSSLMMKVPDHVYRVCLRLDL
jgi:hypothetical protein